MLHLFVRPLLKLLEAVPRHRQRIGAQAVRSHEPLNFALGLWPSGLARINMELQKLSKASI
jgi:hypothetical protein